MKPCKLPVVSQSLFPRTIDELFNRFWDDSRSGTSWSPSVDVSETPDAYIIRAELPGVDVGDVEVTVTSDSLTIKGEKKVENVADAEERVSERVLGAFSRSFSFPVHVATDEVQAESRRGVLEITVRKAETAKTRRIEIKSD